VFYLVSLSVLFALGVVVAIAARLRHKRLVEAPVASQRANLIGGSVGAGIATISGILIASSFFTVVESNTVAIPTQFGSVGDPLTSGIHVVPPWTKTVEFSTRIQELSMLRAVDEGDLEKDDSVEVIAAGGGSMRVDLTVRFSIDPTQVPLVFRESGSLETLKTRIVRPEAREVVRNVFGTFSAEEGYSTKRVEIATAINDSLRERLVKHGIILESVNVRDVNPEQQVLDSINAILEARNAASRAIEDQRLQVTEAETRQQVASLDKEATITAAEAAADTTRLEAQAQADRTRIEAEAQAEANAQVAASLTPELLEMLIAEQCAKAIAESNAQVINVCGPGTAAGAEVPSSAVIVDSRLPQP
jgi:regulator of protease activity HflC (stomatin/prohibitin superfamily)